MTITVRRATPEEAPRLFSMLVAMHATGGFFTRDDDLVRGKLVQVYERGWPLVAVNGAGTLVGTLGLERRPVAWYSRDEIVGEVWMYVAPDGRGTHAIHRLTAHAKAIARALGLPLMASEWSRIDGPRKWKLFGRLLPKIGEIYLSTEH